MDPGDFNAFEGLDGLVIVLEPEGTIAYWNPACSALTGRPLEAVRGRPLWEVLGVAAGPEGLEPVIEGLRERGRVESFELECRLEPGRLRSLALTGSVVERGDDARERLLVLVGLDVTGILAARAERPEGGSRSVVRLPRRAPAGTALEKRPGPERAGLEQVREVIDELRGRPLPLPVPAAAGEQPLVLVVEDNREMNRYLCEHLGAEHRVAAAFDGEEALRMALELRPDLILTDLVMGEMSGVKLVQEIRGRDEMTDTPIVILSAVADEELRVELLRDGAQDYVTKPFSIDELRARIGNLIAQKQALQRLRLSEAKFSGIVSISADAVISIDERQRITIFNEGAEKIFGYTMAEVIGAPLDLLIPERFREVHREHVERFAASSNVARRMGERGTAIFGLRRDGEEFPAEAAISNLQVGSERVLTVSLRDTTEQKRAENEQKFLAEVGQVLAATLEYEETLTNVAALAVRDFADLCIVDIVEEDGQIRRLRAVSKDPSRSWVCDWLMRSPVDRERPHLMFSALQTRKPVLVPHFTAEMVSAIAQDEEDLRLLRALDPRSFLAVPLLARDKLLGVIALVSSHPSRVYGPAELRLVEELVRRAALSIDNARLYRAARRASHERDEVLGVVAHDLRNPLNALVLQAQLLRRSPDESELRSRERAAAIERAARRMDRLIEDLVDVTKMEAGRLSIEARQVSAEQVLADSVRAQEALAASRSIDLRLYLAQDLPEVWADRDRLLQVLENLVSNAVKFTEPGGQINVGAVPKEGEVLFWVADDGIGIAAEDVPHLFDRFWQARKAERRGAGLGLPIVKGIVEAHRGRIWVDSRLGKGTTFYFTVPAVAPMEAREPRPAPP